MMKTFIYFSEDEFDNWIIATSPFRKYEGRNNYSEIELGIMFLGTEYGKAKFMLIDEKKYVMFCLTR